MRTERWWYHLRWDHVLAVAGAIVVAAAVPCMPPSPAPCPPAEVHGLMPVDGLPPALGVPMVGPLDGQKRPPCKGPKEKGLREHELLGACWYRVEGEPPCGEGYQNGGNCYAPVPARFKVPSTMGLEPQERQR